MLGVGSGTGGTTSGAYTFFASGSTGLTNSSIAVIYCAIFGGSIWIASGRVMTSSDRRIKENIQDINDDSALQMILAIKPTTYDYIDKAKSTNKIYGFIAQQIREVIPEATQLTTGYIPNIMLLADFNDYVITLPSIPTKVIIKLNDKIKCYNEINTCIEVEVVEVIDEFTFRIFIPDEEYRNYTNNKILVYGTEVDDFHTLTKEYIFTLNVCATQELHRKIVSQEERIKELETKLEKLINYIYQ